MTTPVMNIMTGLWWESWQVTLIATPVMNIIIDLWWESWQVTIITTPVMNIMTPDKWQGSRHLWWTLWQICNENHNTWQRACTGFPAGPISKGDSSKIQLLPQETDFKPKPLLPRLLLPPSPSTPHPKFVVRIMRPKDELGTCNEYWDTGNEHWHP